MNQSAPLALPEDHPRCLAAASIVVGRELAELDGKPERRRRKIRVLERRLSELRREAPDASTFTDLSAVALKARFTSRNGARDAAGRKGAWHWRGGQIACQGSSYMRQ